MKTTTIKKKTSNLPQKRELGNVLAKLDAVKKGEKTKKSMERRVGNRVYAMRAQSYLTNPMRSGRPFRVRQVDVDTAAITSSAGGVGYAKNFQLDQLIQFAEFADIFDQYRFVRIKARFLPRINQHNLTTMSATATTTLSPLAVIWDPDDAVTPSSFNDVAGYPNIRIEPGYREVELEFKPRAAIAAYGGAFTQFADFDGWIDCASDDVEYYAIKAWQFGDGVSQTTHAVWDCVYEVDCEFRFVH